MKGIKLVALVFGIIAVIGIAVFSFAVFSFEQERLAAAREERLLYELLIPAFAPDLSCDISEGTASQTYSITIKSPDVRETKTDIEILFKSYDGELKYSTENTNFFSGTLIPFTRSASISGTLLLEESEVFIASLKSMNPPEYLVFEKESTYYEGTTSLRQRCGSLLNTFVQLQAEEKLYIDQFKERPTEELINKIGDVRNKALSHSRLLSDELLRFLNKVEITITIEQLLG